MYRYFKIEKGTKRFDLVKEMLDVMSNGQKAMRSLAKELGAINGDATAWDSYLVGGLTGFRFDSNPPEGWRKAKQWGYYYPKSKGNDEIHKKIASIGRVDKTELSKLVGHTSAFGSPGVALRGDFILVEMSASYEPLSDMVEILGSEYKSLMSDH